MDLTEHTMGPGEDFGGPTTSPDGDASSEPAPSGPQRKITAVWVHEGPVCVAIIDSPPSPPSGGICHCSACHGSLNADSAAWFV